MRRLGLISLLFGAITASACGPSQEGPPGSGGGGAGTTSSATSTTSSTSSTSTTKPPPVAWCNKGSPEACNPFGVDLSVPPLAGDAYWAVITKSLQVPFYRPGTLYLDAGGDCPQCLEGIVNGRKLVLVVRANGGPGKPTTPPESLAMYQHQLGELLDANLSAVAAVVIEDGIDSPESWGGSVEQYLDLLAAGCETAHMRSMSCADAGLTSTTMLLLLAEHHAAAGAVESAIQILTTASDNPEVVAAFPVFPPKTAEDLAAGFASQKARLDAAKKLLPGAREAGADLINFHWYERDQDALDNSMALARNLSGCNALMTSNIGQRTQDGLEAFRKAQDAAELGMQIVVWSSRAESGAALLCDASGTLTENGVTLQGLATTAICGD